jgi:hypothetical protein
MPLPRPRPLALAFAVFAGFLCFGAKLSLIRAYGSDVPYRDEWDAVGRLLLLPRSLGELHAGNFLEAQNEHRIVLSRLLAYSLAVSNGQWDALLEMSVNAAIHSAFCAALLLLARRVVTGVPFAWVALVSISLFVLPFDWENTLQGIQSQFYLLEWGALGMFLLCVPSEPLSRRWWAGWLIGAVSLGTMSSGFMAAAVVLLLLLLRAGLERRLSSRGALSAAILFALCAAGLLTIVHVPGHDSLRSHSPVQWAAAAASALSWPEMDWPAAFVVLQLPVAILVAKSLRARRIGPEGSVVAALALWSWLQIAAIAFGRAKDGMAGSSRYMDIYAVGSFANALALALLWVRGDRFRKTGLLAIAWTALFCCGLWSSTQDARRDFLADIPGRKAAERRHVISFLETGDLAVLASARPEELPYPSAQTLAGLLRAPGIRAVLPVSVRPALALSPDAGSGGFQVSGPAPESTARTWTAQSGPARFASRPLPAAMLPYLHLSVSGGPDLNASLLRLESARGSEPLPPYGLLGGRAHSADIPVQGDRPVHLAVEIPPGEHGFSFTEPVELGRESWANRWLLRRAGELAGVSGALLGAAWAALLIIDLRSRAARGAEAQKWW